MFISIREAGDLCCRSLDLKAVQQCPERISSTQISVQLIEVLRTDA